ncbi:MAG: GGDEF domain-containing protein [Coriobacteriales bacterium]|nr:GGDEF domain-containing protein [Coriobacteriales bacterium]
MNEKQKQLAKQNGGVSIRVVGIITTVIAIGLSFYAFALSGYIAETEISLAAEEARYVECSNAVDELQAASDYLTSESRMYVVTGRREHLDNYVNEYAVSSRREKAVDVMRSNVAENQEAINELEMALDSSNGLAKSELAAMRLAADYYELEDLPEEIATVSTDLFRSTPDKDSKLNAARGLVLSDNYDSAKKSIVERVQASSMALLEDLNADLQTSSDAMKSLLFQLRIAVALLLCVILLFVLALFMYVLKPLGRYVERLSGDEPLEPDGAYELHYLANAYNTIYEDNTKRIEQLRKYAEQDPLTGISNRGGYDNFLATHTRNIALLLIDVDNFMDFNAVYGHDTGDAVLIKLAEALVTAFRSTDFPCRIEGDRFAVIMTNMNTELRYAILSKIELVHSILDDDSSNLPAVTLSVGAAFSTEGMNDKDIYRAASTALSQAKQAEPNSVVFYGEGVVTADEE